MPMSKRASLNASFKFSDDGSEVELTSPDDGEPPPSSALSSGDTGNRSALTNDEASGASPSGMSAIQMVQRDLRKLMLQKVALLLTFILVLVLFCVLTALSLRRREEDMFESEFHQLGSDVATVVIGQFANLLWNVHSTSLSVSSNAQFYASPWPNVIVPNFAATTTPTDGGTPTNLMFLPLVTQTTRTNWEAFAVTNEQVLDLTPQDACSGGENDDATRCSNRTIADGIYRFQDDEESLSSSIVIVPDTGTGPYYPAFQIATASNNQQQQDDLAGLVLVNLYSMTTVATALDAMVSDSRAVFTDEILEQDSSISRVYYPILQDFESSTTITGNTVVGCMRLEFSWFALLEGSTIAAPTEGSITLVLTSPSGIVQSYSINSDNQVTFLGLGDQHDDDYDASEIVMNVGAAGISNASIALSPDFSLGVQVYPNASFKDAYVTNRPAIHASILLIAFLFSAGMFVLYYQLIVEQRPIWKQTKEFVTRRMSTTAAAVEQIEPSRPHEHFERARRRSRRMSKELSTHIMDQIVEPAQSRLRTFLHESELTETDLARMEQHKLEEPIADLFPETTIMFADISGFSAWSSEREPSQVFCLLETLYRSFDQLASRLGVFKVETFGDCYVAVTGLPDPNEKHALVMARFAYECVLKMNELVKSLEASLGPGTSDLSVRVGLHSGPVTAGVLRGDKPRFQLFGDAVNTAARMEATSDKYKIQVSEDTAKLLTLAGKRHWITPREEMIHVKGKGEMNTFWLQPRQQGSSDDGEDDSLEGFPEAENPPNGVGPPARRSSSTENWGNLNLDAYGVDEDKKARLVNWNAEVLGDLLSKVVVWRDIRTTQTRKMGRSDSLVTTDISLTGGSVLAEVSEIIHLPSYTENATLLHSRIADTSQLPWAVKHQLHVYISRLSDYYHNVPFHNLEHASHVTLSATKLMKRIVAPGAADFKRPDHPSRMMRRRSFGDVQNDLESVERNLHHSTFGISSDPLCHFAIVYSALIHDVDHVGVPNAQLVKENSPIAARYSNKSVAEQNSVDIAWEILMEEEFEELRECIFATESERKRFRRLVVNSVMATDIVDKELKMLRNNRWAKAFDLSRIESVSQVDIDRKATIVIEHIIQASDVAHTMQHWHIYCKWNEKLFCEMYNAFKEGRAAKDPSVGWYEGEIWFFDNYIIPLAKKLKECGVFGVASDEYLNYAEENRREWKRKGRIVLATMVAAYKQRHGIRMEPPIITKKLSKEEPTSTPSDTDAATTEDSSKAENVDAKTATDQPQGTDNNV